MRPASEAFSRAISSLLAGMALLLSSCAEPARSSRVPRRVEPLRSERDTTKLRTEEAVDSRARIVLPVSSRAQSSASPREGWCGETAIQEGLLYLGAFVPQSAIHRAGRPTHPDLYSHELPIALEALGVQYTRFPGGSYAAFLAWVREGLERGAPTLAGVKLLPTEHPEWGLDHFVLVVGEGEPGLLVDTTWGTREWSNEKKRQGISFERAGYGLRLEGLVPLEPPTGLGGTVPARVAVVHEDAREVALRVTCVGSLHAAYVEQRSAPLDARAESRPMPLSGSLDVQGSAERALWFRCRLP